MKNTYQLRLIFSKTFSLYNITSLIESVQGVRIQHLNFIGKEKGGEGTLRFEATDMVKFNSVIRLIRSRKEVAIVDYDAPL